MEKSCGGVRCSEPGWAQERKEKCFFNRDSEGAFGLESANRGGSLWTRSRWGKAVAGSGVRRHQKRKKSVFLIGIQRGHLAAKVRSGEARFGPELDGEKLWRGQVFGRTPERKEKCFFNRDSEGVFGSESAIRGGSFWTRIRWGKAVAESGVRRHQKGKKSVFLIGIQRGRLATRIRWRKAVAGSGVRKGARKERKEFFK